MLLGDSGSPPAWPACCLQERHDSSIDLARAFHVNEVARAREHDLLETFREEIVHALEGLEPSGPISGAVHGERRDRRRGRADALLQALECRIAVRRLERWAGGSE